MEFRLSRMFAVVALTALTGVGGAGCDKGSDTSEASADDDDDDDDDDNKKKKKKKKGGAAESLEIKIDEVRGMVKEGKPISEDQYEKLILAHANCKVTDNGIDPKCEAVEIMRESMNRSQLAKGALGGNSKLGQKLIGHSSPAVRLKAAQIMGSMLGTGKKSQKLIVDAAKDEENPAVLTAMIRTVRNDGARNADVGKMLLSVADHDNPKIRKEAIYGLSSSWNVELKGGADKLAEMMTSDKEMDVRQAACEYAGGLGDKKLFPVYKKLLEDRDNGPLWGACFKGLVTMWADYPLYGTDSEDAYKLTLELLESKPRAKDIPPWGAMSSFGHLANTENNKFVEWKNKATWFNVNDVKKALTSVIADGDAYWMARTGATDSLGKLGASKAELETLRKSLGDSPSGDDSHVAKALDKAIAAAK